MKLKHVVAVFSFGILLSSVVGVILAIIMHAGEGMKEKEGKSNERKMLERGESRAATAPELDTSHMLLVPAVNVEDMYWYGRFGGQVGIINFHMLVTARDGHRYLCFATEHNVRALWSAGFALNGVEPHLLRSGGLELHEVQFEAYPAMLGRYPGGSEIWRRWATLREEFDSWGGDYEGVIDKYYDHSQPRQEPVG